jgi:hypothetical protein
VRHGTGDPFCTTRAPMPLVTVNRPATDGPFHVGDRCEVAAEDSAEHYRGVVRGVTLLDKRRGNYVKVTVELTNAEHKRWIAASK